MNPDIPMGHDQALKVRSPAAVKIGGIQLKGADGGDPAPRFTVDVKDWLARNAAVETTRNLVDDIEASVRELPDVEHVHWLAGNSFPSVYYNLIMNRDDAPCFAQGVIEMTTPHAVHPLVPELQQTLDERFPQVQIVLGKFGQGPPTDAEIELRLIGPDTARLQTLGERVRRELQHHEGVLHTRMTLPRGQPKLWLTADEDEARLVGLSLRDLENQLQTNLEGSMGGSVLEDLEELAVRVRYASRHRAGIDEIASLSFANGASTSSVPMAALGRLSVRPELPAIPRYDTNRVNVVEGYPREGVLPIDVTAQVLERLNGVGFELPQGYRMELAGEVEASGDATANLTTYAPLLGILMVAALILAFRSVRIFLILLAAGGLSAGLGLAATWVIDFPISFNTILGTIGLVGVAFNNSIVVLAAIRANADARACAPAAIVDEVLGTGRHLLSTTLTTIGGFMPLLLLTGGNFWPSLAIVLAGGVAGAMFLAMTWTPASYYLLFRSRGNATT